MLPEYREFERWSTTVVNAYVDAAHRSVSRARSRPALGRRGSPIMQSNGGSISAAAARAQAVRTVLSGPAAGVVGARAVARAAGFARVISFDMGGTSTDVSLIDDAIATTTDSRIGDFPVRLPVIDIHTVGAGGGSIAYVDTGGALRVGPRSAGAVPGPVCYGTGTELTVTDANLLLGRLDPEFFLGGRMALDVGRARAVAAATWRARLKLSVAELAEGIVRVANANMERAIRVVSVERGHDPRRFALVAFGGAGGMHACEIAERLEIGTVLVPRHAGVLSALGMLVADVTRDYSASVLRAERRVDLAAARSTRRRRSSRARDDELGARRIRAAAQRRSSGWSTCATSGSRTRSRVPFARDYRPAFDRRHGRLYGYANPTRPAEVVAVRVRAAGHHDEAARCRSRGRAASTPRPARRARRPLRRPQRADRVLSLGRLLAPGAARARARRSSPAREATVVVPPRLAVQRRRLRERDRDADCSRP